MTDLGSLPGTTFSQGMALNSFGVVVGQVNDGPSGSMAFIYDGTGMYDLKSLVIDAPDWLLLTASGINDRGQIVGTGFVNGRLEGFLLTPVDAAEVPEPGAWALSALGVALTWVARRRRLSN